MESIVSVIWDELWRNRVFVAGAETKISYLNVEFSCLYVYSLWGRLGLSGR